MRNRSVPCDTVLPHVVYDDVDRAIEYLTRTLGFTEYYRYGDPTAGAQIRLGATPIMLRSSRTDSRTPRELGKWTQSLTLYVEDVEVHYAMAKAAGAVITDELRQTIYGERVYNVEDFAGHPWEFSQHVRDIPPEEWGARVAQP